MSEIPHGSSQRSLTGVPRRNAPPPPLRAPFNLLATPLAWCYGLAVRMRNARFDAGVGVQHLPLPVISIGNLTAGGTGKTPFVAWMAAALVARAHRPLIAMRGYKAPPGEAGDEEREYRSLLPGVPVVAHPKRYDAIMAYLARTPAEEAPDCVLLDDGFQHRQIHRDFDVVLIDATRDALGDRLLPSGWLREPATHLARASCTIVTRADAVDDALASRIAALHGKPPLAWTRHAWRSLVLHDERGRDECPVAWLRGKRIVTFCGVGNPRSVQRTVEDEGGILAGNVPAADHAAVTPQTLRRVAAATRGADAVLVTRKDWVKIEPHLTSATHADRHLLREMPPIVVPELRLEFLEGEEATYTAIRNALAAPAQ